MSTQTTQSQTQVKLASSKDETVSPKMFLQNFWSCLGRKKRFDLLEPISVIEELSGNVTAARSCPEWVASDEPKWHFKGLVIL